MADTSAGGLYQCINDIVRADTSGDYQKALQASNKLLRKYPKEIFAFKCKLVALIQLSMWDDALTFLKKTPSHQMGEAKFEKAYIHYRLNDLDTALASLADAASDDFKSLELKAQILYRKEEFAEAAEVFRHILKNHSDDSDELRRANYLAVQARLEAQGEKQQVDDVSNDSYAQLYNQACVLIESEQLESALSVLNKAIVVGRQQLVDEGRDEEEIEEELDTIRVQRAFILQQIGQEEEALEFYKKAQSSNPSDESIKATVINNIPAASKNVSLVESRKKFKAALAVDQSKLTKRQRRTLMLNNALVLLLSNQREPCKRVLEELTTKYGSSKEVSLIEASLHVRSNEPEKAVKVLSDSDVQQQVAHVHILINAGKLEEAVSVLKGTLQKSIQNTPAVRSLLSSLLIAIDKKLDALEVITAAIESTKDTEVLKQLLEQAADLEVASGNFKNAVKHLEKLVSKFPEDTNAACKLIKAYSVVDAKKAEALSDKLFPDTVSEDLNIDELEESDWILYGEKYKQKKEAKGDIEDSEIVTRTLKNTNRKRKIRLPKNYDPNVAPDPERWLPKQERTAFKKKRRNREREIGRGTQGSSTANPNVEYTTQSPNSPRPLATPQEGPRQQRPKQPKKKKKSTF